MPPGNVAKGKNAVGMNAVGKKAVGKNREEQVGSGESFDRTRRQLLGD
jgi:hypothetical protein